MSTNSFLSGRLFKQQPAHPSQSSHPHTTHKPNSTHTHMSHLPKLPKPEDIPFTYYWRTIDNSKNVQLKLLSAYYDNRFSSEVYLLGYENHDVKHNYYCLFGYKDRVVCSTAPAKRLNVNDDVDPYKDYHIALWGFYYICPLPDNTVPAWATISLQPDCTLNSDKDWLPVQNRNPNNVSTKAKFGVCLQGPVYDIKDPQIIVEFVELHRALGAEIITMYVQTASPLVWKAMQQYADEGLVDLINWNLTFVKDAGYVHYKGQSLLVNECVYRNMYRVEYLAMNDLDEVIVPQGNLHSWGDMIKVIEDNGRGAFLFPHTSFTKDRKDIKAELLQCKSETKTSLRAIEIPRYVRKFKRFSSGGYEKLIVKPLCVKKVSFHRIFGFVDGYSLYKVPSNVGMSYHYREPPLPTSGHVTTDSRLLTLFPNVLDKIRERLCSLYTDI